MMEMDLQFLRVDLRLLIRGILRVQNQIPLRDLLKDVDERNNDGIRKTFRTLRKQ